MAKSSVQHMVTKRVLILSSGDSYAGAVALAEHLHGHSKGKVQATPWKHMPQTRGSGYHIDQVLSAIRTHPYVVLLFTPDDTVVKGRRRTAVPRDNVVMELGMAIATNGAPRTFILRDASFELHVPTNIVGVVQKQYTRGETGNWAVAMEPLALRLLEEIEAVANEMSWDQLWEEVDELRTYVTTSTAHGGFRPHVVVGVNMGGLLAASLLYYRCGQPGWHLMPFWTRDASTYRSLLERKDDALGELTRVLAAIRTRGERPRILLLDDSCKSGGAFAVATEAISAVAGDVELRRAAIVHLGDPSQAPDWHGGHRVDHFKYGPV